MPLTTAIEKMTAARIQLQTENPFFSYLILHLEMIENKEIETAGVDGKGHLFYNPEFVEKFDVNTCKGLLAHEVMHLVLEHNLRVCKRDHLIFNVAGDAVINTILVNNDFRLPPDGIKPKHKDSNEITIDGVGTFKNLDKKSAEELYEEIYKKLPKTTAKKLIVEIDFTNDSEGNGSGDAGKKDGEGKKKSGNTSLEAAAAEMRQKLDEERKKKAAAGGSEGDKSGEKDEKDANGSGKMTIEIEEKDWKKIFTEAVLFSKMRGNTPAGLDRYFEHLYDEQLNWRELLQRYIISAVPFDYSYSRPSKKSVSTGFYMPIVKRENIEVVVSVDTSGSIGQDILQDFFAEIHGVLGSFPNVKMILLVHDAAVLDCFEITSLAELEQVKFRGGGGTDHVPVYEYIKEHYPQAELLVSLTDGYSRFPDSEEVKTIFVLTENSQEPPFGDIVKIENRNGKNGRRF